MATRITTRKIILWLTTALSVLCAAVAVIMLAPEKAVNAVAAERLYALGEGIPVNETTFPDANFREYVNIFCDDDEDGVLSVEEIAECKEFGMTLKGISSLKGIEHFTALTTLYCAGNSLTELDLSANTALTHLECWGNGLKELDLSANTALTYLDCSDNSLTELDLSANTLLTYLNCSDNCLAELDLSENTALTELICSWNYLATLDLSANTELTRLYCSDNALTSLDLSENTMLTELICDKQHRTVEVRQNGTACTYDFSALIGDFSRASGIGVMCGELGEDEKTVTFTRGAVKINYQYATNCDGQTMDVTLILYREGILREVALDASTFPDEGFRSCVAQNYDRNDDGILSETELAMQTSIDVIGCEIRDLTGIEYFAALMVLECFSNNIASLDLSANTALMELNCSYNQLTSLSVSENTALTVLDCSNNALTSLDLSENTALMELDCSSNALTSLDLSENTALAELDCWRNQLTVLDLSANSALTECECSENAIASLDLSENTALMTLDCASNNLVSIVFSENTALIELYCSENDLTALDVSANKALTRLDCSQNAIISLDLSENTALRELDCYENDLTALDVSANKALTRLDCSENAVASLDLSENTALVNLYCNENALTMLDVSANTALEYLQCEEQHGSYEGKAAGDEYSFDISSLVGDWERVSGLSVAGGTLGADGRTVTFAEKAIVMYEYVTGYEDEVMDVTLTLMPEEEEPSDPDGETPSDPDEETPSDPDGETPGDPDGETPSDPDEGTPGDSGEDAVSGSHGGLPDNLIVYIVIGCVFGVLLILYVVFALLFKKGIVKGAFFSKIYPFIK